MARLSISFSPYDYEDRHILDMETEVLPLVETAKELIDLVSEMAKKQLKELTL